ncbi:MAG: 50S ribosomal protein L9 [Phycisphaerales bacterium]|nr:MAG: 50S ribosomal protein L9 [Phycisphaerales bacterium]
MAKTVKLLLTESVDSLGIVGDVVGVRLGYARNFLLPRGLATTPSDELIQQLASKRAEAQKQLALLRKQREDMVKKIEGISIELIRSCNDQGILYGGVTQQELATVLTEKGYKVKPREIRINETIKRLGTYDIHVKLDSDLDATLKLKINPDRELDLDEEKPEAAASEHSPAEGAAPAENAEGGEKKARKPRAKAETAQ